MDSRRNSPPKLRSSLTSGAQDNWPAYLPGASTPGLAKPARVHLDRIAALRCDKPLGRGPRTHVIQQLVGAPVSSDAKLTDHDFSERHTDRWILIFDNLALRRPVIFNLIENPEYDRVDVIVDYAILITPEGQNSTWLQHPRRFFEKGANIEPVQGLGYRNKIDRVCRQS